MNESLSCGDSARHLATLARWARTCNITTYHNDPTWWVEG